MAEPSPCCIVRALVLAFLNGSSIAWKEMFIGGTSAITAAFSSGLAVAPLSRRLGSAEIVNVPGHRGLATAAFTVDRRSADEGVAARVHGGVPRTSRGEQRSGSVPPGPGSLRRQAFDACDQCSASIIVIVLARRLHRFPDPVHGSAGRSAIDLGGALVGPTSSVHFTIAVARLIIDHHAFFAICPDAPAVE